MMMARSTDVSRSRASRLPTVIFRWKFMFWFFLRLQYEHTPVVSNYLHTHTHTRHTCYILWCIEAEGARTRCLRCGLVTGYYYYYYADSAAQRRRWFVWFCAACALVWIRVIIIFFLNTYFDPICRTSIAYRVSSLSERAFGSALFARLALAALSAG